MKIYYHGTLTNPLVKLRGSKQTIKIKNGEPFDVSEIDWAYLSTSGVFSKFEIIPVGEVITTADMVEPVDLNEPAKVIKKKKIKKEEDK